MADQNPAPITSPKDVWKRGLFMLLFIVTFGIGQMVLNVIAIVQFLWLLITRKPNEYLARFGGSLSIWLADVAGFNPAPPTKSPSPSAPGRKANIARPCYP